MGSVEPCSTSRVVRPSRRAAALCLRCLLRSVLPSRPASGTLNIAYNVNLPSFDPERWGVVGQPDHPGDLPLGLRSIYRPEAQFSFEPGLLTDWGWNDDKAKSGWTCGKTSSGTTARRSHRKMSSGRSSARPTRWRQSSAFIWAGIDNFKVDGKRITAEVKQYDPVSSRGWRSSPATCCQKPSSRRSAPEGFEKEAGRHRPLHGRCLRRQRYLRLKANPKIGAASPPSKPSCSSSRPMQRAASPKIQRRVGRYARTTEKGTIGSGARRARKAISRQLPTSA